MTENTAAAEDIIRNSPRLSRDDRFDFRCDKSLECFTCCCSDVSIVLTPYDVLRMKHALRLDSSEFLVRHTISPFSKDQKIPVVLLKMNPESKKCPFVSAEGCGIYANRPWACRMYPLGMAEPDHPTPTDSAFHFIIRDDFCRGHDAGPAVAVREWINDQGIEEYDMMAAPFKELMFHPFWEREDPLTPAQMDMYYMACYDLDRFRRFVFTTRFLELFDVDEARVEAMRNDDVELLDFAMQWLRFSLFHDRTMKVKPSGAATKRYSATPAAQSIHG
jgi:Fe-S-cluster containining protein